MCNFLPLDHTVGAQVMCADPGCGRVAEITGVERRYGRFGETTRLALKPIDARSELSHEQEPIRSAA